MRDDLYIDPDRNEVPIMGSVIKKRRKRMSKKKHRKMLRRTRVQRRKLGK
ncbi:Ribosomal protein mS38 C-terminal domain-containing protein [Corynebacterium falsenii]